VNARSAAIDVLITVIEQGRSLSTTLAETKVNVALDERPLLQEICYGVLRHYWPLAAIATQVLDRPLAKKHADLRIALLVGLYQLRHMRIPDHAVLMETVALADGRGKGWGKGLLNATLRRYQRERTQIEEVLEHSDEARLAHPDWLIQRIRDAWPDQADAILAANNLAPPLILRTNRLRITRDRYLTMLAEQEVEASAALLSPWGVYLTTPRDVENIPGFAEGFVSVQDEAAQLASTLVEPKPGSRVLDACAAPGGKCGHLLELEPELSELIALDLDASRLDRVAENLTRLGITAKLLSGDAARPSGWWDGEKFDRILLDVPCSGTGVIRRNPDIKLLRKEEDVAKLAGQQRALLDALWPLLNAGGTLVYSTCSVLPEENWLTVSAFMDETSDAVEKPITDGWGEAVAVGRQLLPASPGHDGFYYARLAKQ